MTGKIRPSLTGLFLVLTLPLSASAQLAVIYDSGQTQPIAPFLESIRAMESQNPKANDNAKSAQMNIQQLGPAKLTNLLPVRSPGLAPGPVSEGAGSRQALERLALGNARPFFLVGSDALSQSWLKARRTELLRLGAVGMLIQADTEVDVQRIAALAQGLPITLGSASDIAKALGIDRYPVLISSRGIEQ